MITLAAGIPAVTVYTDRARVTRQGVVHLAAGQQVVALSNLPAVEPTYEKRRAKMNRNILFSLFVLCVSVCCSEDLLLSLRPIHGFLLSKLTGSILLIRDNGPRCL